MRLIGGKYKGRTIQAPKTGVTRPTQESIRETLFNICQNSIEGARVLDLFAGSGAIGLEALSRGALHATLVDKNQMAMNCIQQNIKTLGCMEDVTTLKLSFEIALQKIDGPFDLIYVDPPYEFPLIPIVEQILRRNLLKEGGNLFLEERYRKDHEKNPPCFDQLTHKKSRKIGSTLLHHYYVKETLDN